MDIQKEQGAIDRMLQEDVIDLRQYWQTIMRHKWGIIGFAFIVTLLTALVVASLTPIYRATATLLIESQQANIVSIEEVYGLDGGNSEYFTTQFEILKSRNLAEKVVAKLDLVNHPIFNKPKESLLPFDFNWRDWLPFELPAAPVVVETQEIKFRNVVDQFMGGLTVSPLRKTQLVKLTYESSDALLATKIANAVGESYIESNLDAKLQLTLKASSWLSGQLEGLRSELTKAEQRLQEYREQEQIVGEKGGLNIAGQELELVAGKLVDARRDRLEAESLYSQVRAIGKKNPARLELVPTVLQHPLVQRMKESYARVELKRSELAKRYGAKHPTMRAVNSELANARSALHRQILSVVNGIETNYKVAVANENSLKSALEGTKGNIQNLSRKEYKLSEYQQDVETKRTVFNTFLTRFNETSATGDLKTANARVSDPAVVPLHPAKPKKKLIVALAFVVSAMFGVMFAFVLQALNNTVKSASEVESKLGVVMLGLLPLLPKKKKTPNQSYGQFIDDPQSAYAESLRTIRTGLILSALDNPHKTVSITSSVPGEGKTSLALGLAFSTGQMEKVLLVDADLRRPSVAKALGLDRAASGLSNLVAGTASVDECIQRYEEGNIDVICAGIIPPNPSELLSSKRFADVLAMLETKYDRIIIDTAPSQAVSDAMVLAPLVGAMIYVVRSDSTPYQHAKNGLKRLREVNAPIIGVVLNQVDVKKGAKYYGQEYGGYYDVYGYSSEKA
ncbi:GumC family protein [Neptunomonas japonica]|uniref:non-specific protein-tyrosine kinase n=1 Tax=Neptunomonas japonica JAMM 1380 TaxID=1441457 RepID=A0A7R6SUZ2_9GAMM|nr:polysaccharide biosynthesis tyrosine autokinase [Neptunomonas japonica]BBB28885.1 exopolysaccharide biosynthesis protein [Neptunomonas japonica JAMM 1380]